MKKNWADISHNEWCELKEKYFVYEEVENEELYIKGYMSDGLSEDEVFQMLTDNVHDYYYQNKITLESEK